MKKRFHILVLSTLTLLQGCVATTDTYQDAQAEQRAAQAELTEFQRQIARGADEAIHLMLPETKQNDPAWPVAARLTGAHRNLLGEPFRPLNIEAIIGGESTFIKQMDETVDSARKLSKEIEERDVKIRDLERRVIALAREAEEARRKSFVGRIKSALYSVAGIILFVGILYALLVSGALPSLALKLGMVPAKVVRGIVRGTGHIRAELKKGKALTIEEADRLLEPTVGRYDREWIRPIREDEDV